MSDDSPTALFKFYAVANIHNDYTTINSATFKITKLHYLQTIIQLSLSTFQFLGNCKLAH